MVFVYFVKKVYNVLLMETLINDCCSKVKGFILYNLDGIQPFSY